MYYELHEWLVQIFDLQCRQKVVKGCKRNAFVTPTYGKFCLKDNVISLNGLEMAVKESKFEYGIVTDYRKQ